MPKIHGPVSPAPLYDSAPMTDVAIVGAGYVGVPLAQVFAEAGRSVLLVERDAERVAQLNRGESYIEDVPSEALKRLVDARTAARDDRLRRAARRGRDPDRAADAALEAARAGPLDRERGHRGDREAAPQGPPRRARVDDVSRHDPRGAAAAARGVRAQVGEDFNLAFSPERVDPGREDWTTKNVPKIVGGITEACTERAAELYGSAVDTVHRVTSPESAELTKLLENIFRSVNIALVNELAQLCERMKIDFWEVVDAAATKPFGFMSFKPGPGLGGHCIPIDPFYLTWKAREYNFYTEFIELAGKVNENMPYYCRSLISQALNHGKQLSLKGSQVLVLGVAYKPGIGDMRESPALKLIELLQAAGAEISYHDPHVPELPELRPLVGPARAGALRLHRDRHRPRGHRLRGARRRRRRDRRLPQRDRREGPPQRQGLEAVSRARRPGGPRLLGPEPGAELRHPRRPRVALRPRRASSAQPSRRDIRARRRPATSPRCWPTPSSTRS